MQFNYYVNKHAEQLREHFVNLAGKRKLTIKMDGLNMPASVSQMADLIHKNIKDAELRDWIMPNFTTTTDTDKVAASIIMMGTMQKYFVYHAEETCGIPSVTLLGEEKDWQDAHTHRFPLEVCQRSSRTWKAPDSPDVMGFWQCAVRSAGVGCAGQQGTNGWVLAFCFWDTEGELLARMRPVFQATRRQIKRHSGVSGKTLVAPDGPAPNRVSHGVPTSTRPAPKPGILEKITRKLLCFKSDASRSSTDNEEENESKNVTSNPKQNMRSDPVVQQLTDSGELNEPWAYEDGGRRDTLPPVTGWLVIRTEGQYGKDPDVLDIQFDSDAEDYDHDLAYNGMPLIK
ncbi:hypothetical protein BU23DRAFT_601670 [Bimuria novae-zelandiae CBS 107.79]|uniref:Uncharacterized protein n=1 Tax=Bimuria novae-zelandiae CBS 107.79 TaxID=1447943 RepID=A0A6A5V7M8_9PLEO|nr:hypothetical protein BU23DRAFT_601670 [Bimuria novae-zelandiae CBS 107.79]